MGQQQLLLLVLSTVIVGLATVAGIQAFSENQAQASQDALVQRATATASDLKALQGKPVQLGGIDLNADSDSDGLPGSNKATAIANRLGIEAGSQSLPSFEVAGAGSSGKCKVTVSKPKVGITCTSADAPQDPQVVFNPSNDTGNQVNTNLTGSFSSPSL